MYLTSTNQSLVFSLDAAPAIELQFIASYQDYENGGMIVTPLSSEGTSSGTSQATIVAAPTTGKQRQIAHFVIFNPNSTSQTIRVFKKSGGTDFKFAEYSMPPLSSVEWSRDNGWEVFNITQASSTNFQVFTSNDTYTKPASLKWALVCIVGAGGGGGSGRQGLAGTNRFGGGGGGGAAITWRLISGTEMPNTVTVTVGTKGIGGAAQAVASSNGNNGTTGGDTSFGALLLARGGIFGQGGTATGSVAGNGGSAITGTIPFGPFTLPGGTGGTGNTNGSGSSGITGLSSTAGAPGGGGGVGYNTANTAGTVAGSGGGVYNGGILVTGPTSGISPNGANNAAQGLFFNLTLLAGYGIGTGGAGGVPPSTNAGNGGNYGAGGGGGYASTDGTPSGKGGDGGNGIAIVFQML